MPTLPLPPLTAKKLLNIGKKREIEIKNQEKLAEIEKKKKKHEKEKKSGRFFHLYPSDWTGYVTGHGKTYLSSNHYGVTAYFASDACQVHVSLFSTLSSFLGNLSNLSSHISPSKSTST